MSTLLPGPNGTIAVMYRVGQSLVGDFWVSRRAELRQDQHGGGGEAGDLTRCLLKEAAG